MSHFQKESLIGCPGFDIKSIESKFKKVPILCMYHNGDKLFQVHSSRKIVSISKKSFPKYSLEKVGKKQERWYNTKHPTHRKSTNK